MDKIASAEAVAANRVTQVVLALSILMASLGTSIANIALPTLSAVFSASFDQVRWVVVAYLAALTVSALVVGRLGDRFGLKRTYLVGLYLFTGASFLCGVAPDLWSLIGVRALQGVGAAFIMTLAIALVRETSAQDRVGRSMGLLGAASAIGTALGPSVGGLLVSTAGWRGIFFVLVPLGLLTLALAMRSLPGSDGTETVQSMRFRAGHAAELYAGLVANLLVAAVMMATLVAGPFYLTIGLGQSAALAGLIMSVGPVISVLGGVLSGRAVDVWGSRRILGIGLVLLMIGAFLLAILAKGFGVGGYVLAIAILTPGYQLFQAANNTAVMAYASKNRRGMTAGLLNLSRNLGLILGAWAIGGFFAFGVGTQEIGNATASAVVNAMQMTFALAGIMVAMALWIVFRQPTGQDTSQAI